jgi:hypothetical protein
MIELREGQERRQQKLDGMHGKLKDLAAALCPIDASVLADNGACPCCGRQVRAVVPEYDLVIEPGTSPEKAQRLEEFRDRYNKQLAGRAGVGRGDVQPPPPRNWRIGVSQAEWSRRESR